MEPATGYALSCEELCEMRQWVLSRSPAVRTVVDRFPPGSTVRARKGRLLLCPAPGERAVVDRYFEADGRVSVGVVGMVFSTVCDPDWIELVDSERQLEFYRWLLEEEEH